MQCSLMGKKSRNLLKMTVKILRKMTRYWCMTRLRKMPRNLNKKEMKYQRLKSFPRVSQRMVL